VSGRAGHSEMLQPPWSKGGADCIPKTSVVNLRQEIEEKITNVANADPWMKEHPPRLETDWWYGTEVDENEPIVEMGIEAVRELGIEAKPSGMGSVTDAVTLIRHLKIPTISIGPDDQKLFSSERFRNAGHFALVQERLNSYGTGRDSIPRGSAMLV